MRKKSHKLQWLEEVNHRGELTKEEANVYHRSKLGHKGETGFDKLCSYFLDKPFSIIDDITLSYQLKLETYFSIRIPWYTKD
ncbi:hypothetical protein, partial [Tetragenococcus halophilus]|uniref:hypothetical protein n=2 Tax=Tetragenococcus halophilus TaxID=51669 RepID=UPI0011AFBA7E